MLLPEERFLDGFDRVAAANYARQIDNVQVITKERVNERGILPSVDYRLVLHPVQKSRVDCLHLGGVGSWVDLIHFSILLGDLLEKIGHAFNGRIG